MAVELIDIDESDVKIGGVLENTIREVTVEAIPTEIPDVIQHSIAGLEVGDTVTLGELKAPAGATIIGDPETVIAAIRTSRATLAEDGGRAGARDRGRRRGRGAPARARATAEAAADGE